MDMSDSDQGMDLDCGSSDSSETVPIFPVVPRKRPSGEAAEAEDDEDEDEDEEEEVEVVEEIKYCLLTHSQLRRRAWSMRERSPDSEDTNHNSVSTPRKKTKRSRSVPSRTSAELEGDKEINTSLSPNSPLIAVDEASKPALLEGIFQAKHDTQKPQEVHEASVGDGASESASKPDPRLSARELNPYRYGSPPISEIKPDITWAIRKFKHHFVDHYTKLPYGPYNDDAPTLVAFHEFWGLGEPPNDIGRAGDIYIDVTPGAHKVFYMSTETWRMFRWPEDPFLYTRSSPDLLNPHPYLLDRFMWIGLNRYADDYSGANILPVVTWYSQSTIRHDPMHSRKGISSHSYDQILHDRLHEYCLRTRKDGLRHSCSQRTSGDSRFLKAAIHHRHIGTREASIGLDNTVLADMHKSPSPHRELPTRPKLKSRGEVFRSRRTRRFTLEDTSEEDVSEDISEDDEPATHETASDLPQRITDKANSLQQDQDGDASEGVDEAGSRVRSKQRITTLKSNLEVDAGIDLSSNTGNDDASNSPMLGRHPQAVDRVPGDETIGTSVAKAANNQNSSVIAHADASTTRSPRPSVPPCVGRGPALKTADAEGSGVETVNASIPADSVLASSTGPANPPSAPQSFSSEETGEARSGRSIEHGKVDAMAKAARAQVESKTMPQANRLNPSTAGRTEPPNGPIGSGSLAGLTPETLEFIRHVKDLTEQVNRETRLREKAENRVKRRDRKIRRLQSSEKRLAKALEEEQSQRQRVEEELARKSEALGECRTTLDNMHDEVQMARKWLEKARDVAAEGLEVVRV